MPEELLVTGREKVNSDFIGSQGVRGKGGGRDRERKTGGERKRQRGRTSFGASAHQQFELM